MIEECHVLVPDGPSTEVKIAIDTRLPGRQSVGSTAHRSHLREVSCAMPLPEVVPSKDLVTLLDDAMVI